MLNNIRHGDGHFSLRFFNFFLRNCGDTLFVFNFLQVFRNFLSTLLIASSETAFDSVRKLEFIVVGKCR